MSVEYVDLIDRFLASELRASFSTEALEASANLSENQLLFFAEQLTAVDEEQHRQMVKAQPAAVVAQPLTAKTDKVVDEDIRPTSAMFSHPYNRLAPVALEHVKRQLLFFSRVAILTPELPYGGDLAQRRRDFRDFLQAFLEIKPLVEDGSVVLLPKKGFYSNEIEGGASLVRQACQEDPALVDWISSHQALLNEFAPGARPWDPYFDAGIRICSAITYGHTLAATHPFVGHVYKLLIADAGRLDRGKIATIQNLDRIDLPGLADLNWADVFAVRRDEACLRKWRADLAVAISSVDPNLPPEDFVERFDSQVQAQLGRAALELESTLKQSSPMARFKKGGANLAISAIAITARVALGGPLAAWDAIVALSKNEGAKEAVRFIWESREAAAKRALRSHYAVFSTKE